MHIPYIPHSEYCMVHISHIVHGERRHVNGGKVWRAEAAQETLAPRRWWRRPSCHDAVAVVRAWNSPRRPADLRENRW